MLQRHNAAMQQAEPPLELVLVSLIATVFMLVAELASALTRERLVRHALGLVRTAAAMPLRPVVSIAGPTE